MSNVPHPWLYTAHGKRVLKKAKRKSKEGESQSQCSVNQSATQKQDFGTRSTEPAEKKMRTSHYEEPAKNISSISQPLANSINNVKCQNFSGSGT